MLRSMYSGISGMKANQAKLDVIGNNIANVSTTAFKASSARFTDMLYQNSSSATAPTATKGGTNANQVGLGAKLSSINKVMSQGNALSTGRSLDVCVDGEGYLMVSAGPVVIDGQNPIDPDTHTLQGGVSQISFTRDGNLTLDKDGNLLTADGYRVMGYMFEDGNGPAIEDDGNGNFTMNRVNPDSEDLKAMGEGAELHTLKIPQTVHDPETDTDQPVANFSIGKDGMIIGILGNGTQTVLGQIATATFTNPEGLTNVGGNLAQVSANSGNAVIRAPKGTEPDKDNSQGFGDLVQGCLEASNVDLTEQFTDMITATRAFQAASKMITTADEILQTVTGLM